MVVRIERVNKTVHDTYIYRHMHYRSINNNNIGPESRARVFETLTKQGGRCQKCKHEAVIVTDFLAGFKINRSTSPQVGKYLPN